MSVSSARDHSGEWCRAALNVVMCRVVTSQVNGCSESRLVGQGGTVRRYSTFGGGGGSCAVRGRGPVVRRSRLGWHVPWPPSAGREVELGGRPRRAGRGATAGMGFRRARRAYLGSGRRSHPSRAPGPRQLQRRLGWPSPAAYRAVELPSPTAGQTDCRRAVRPWTRSGGKTRCPTPPADPPGCGPAPGTRLSVRMKAIPAQSGRCYRSCPELPAAEPGRRRVSVQPAGAAFRRRVEAHVVPLTISESAFRAESRTRSSSSWRAATLAPYHNAVGDWRSPSPGPAHYFPATSSKATAPGKPAAAAIRTRAFHGVPDVAGSKGSPS